MLGKILTADNLQKKGWQNDPICNLCNNEHKTPRHLCKDCPYSRSVWTIISDWWNLITQTNVNL
jgi:uncharacterized OB-fold protein